MYAILIIFYIGYIEIEINFYFYCFTNSILVLAQNEVKNNDHTNQRAIEEMLANIKKISNEATLTVAGVENELDLLEVRVGQTYNSQSKQ